MILPVAARRDATATMFAMLPKTISERVLASCVGLATCLATGCSAARQDRLGVGETRLPAFAEPSALLANDAPSPGLMDRSGWEVATIDVPLDSTVHQPAYRIAAWKPERSPTARQRGAYPDRESALDGGSKSVGARIAEAFVAPLGAALEIVLFPVRAVMSPPWSEAASPASDYERSRPAPDKPTDANPHCPLCPTPEGGS